MNKIENINNNNWLDKIAIFLSATCAVHCLLTPVLIIALPIVSTTFFANANFHLWMLYLVLPTTGLAIFLGCKKHKDKVVISLSALGLLILTGSTIYQLIIQGDSGKCVICATGGHSLNNPLVWINILAGILLISAHVRNFRLCRVHKY
mgnify:FL=1|jgi:hypothetical protein